MLWLPAESAVVIKAAVPEPLTVAVPSDVAPSKKVTVPVGVPAELMTDAVKVTELAKTLGLLFEATAVALAALFTVCASALLVDALKLASPP